MANEWHAEVVGAGFAGAAAAPGRWATPGRGCAPDGRPHRRRRRGHGAGARFARARPLAPTVAGRSHPLADRAATGRTTARASRRDHRMLFRFATHRTP